MVVERFSRRYYPPIREPASPHEREKDQQQADLEANGRGFSGRDDLRKQVKKPAQPKHCLLSFYLMPAHSRNQKPADATDFF